MTMAACFEPHTFALRVRGLSKTYYNSPAPVWSNISFDIPSGQRVAIVGGNGAGKSTLLRCCMRMIESDTGEVYFDGNNISLMRGKALTNARAKVGFVSQKHNLIGRLSVLSNVLHGGMAWSRSPGLWFQGLASNDNREYAMHCLAQVGLAHLCKRRVDGLSGGQSQRVAIARALMQKPRMIFADEPVASLDPQAGEDVMQLFSDLATNEKLTLVFVTHHLEHALQYADRILGLRNFQLSLDAFAQEVNVRQLRGMYE
ncbi:phosphonate ABC transporter ATP-binding protein [Klebsiella aerogenes]|uniref:phosphonate ABC transporter ATP-binding protein n=1 Tax=Klebsiella aerogenes TaxID=548 RepID=UPI0022796F09|nr:ATP-binding cassette domain-containing protein [Klebsiella aerogenes]MCY4763651.1 ATP-binding cassette domain-containing protein [Klebsiella aerogenes]